MQTKLSRSLSEAEIRTFDQDGVVCVKGMFDRDWIERMQKAVDNVLDRPSARGSDLKPESSFGRFAYDNYLWTFDDDFRAMAFDSPIGELAAAILPSRRISVVFDFILVKEPNTPAPTVWHQDIPANPCEGTQTCGLWFSLDHVTADSGAVEWVRGSHRWGRRFEAATTGDPSPHGYLTGFGAETDGELLVEDQVEPVPDVGRHRADYDIVTFDTDPGDCLISSLSMLHAAPGNSTDRRRRAFGYRFAGDDATYAVRNSPRSIKPVRDPGLRHGDPFPAQREHPVFPIWPRSN